MSHAVKTRAALFDNGVKGLLFRSVVWQSFSQFGLMEIFCFSLIWCCSCSHVMVIDLQSMTKCLVNYLDLDCINSRSY